MRVIIMADGKGSRWKNYLGVPKHFAEIEGEPIIQRTVRLLQSHTGDRDELMVTSHNPEYDFPGIRRYEPLDNHYEVDKFTRELIVDGCCFLFGDTFYTEETMEEILHHEMESELLFFGNMKSIVGVRVGSAEAMIHHTDRVRALFIDGKIEKCKGWQVYQSYTGQDFNEPAALGKDFILVGTETLDVNTPAEYLEMQRIREVEK